MQGGKEKLNMAPILLTFPDLPIGSTVYSRLTWSHYKRLMRVENLQARQWCGNIPAKHFHI